MPRDHILKVMTFALKVGEEMLESSVATSDVERAVRRVTESYGLGRCEVSVTLNVITLSYLSPDLDGPITLVKVVDLGDPRLDRLVALDDLTWRVERKELSIDAASIEIDELERSGPPHRWWVTFLAGLVSVAAWIVFAGGGWIGAVAGVCAAIVIQAVVPPLSRTRVPAAFAMALAAVLVVAFPSLFAWAGAPIVLSPAIVGGLYPLLPGGAIVSSVTDGLSGAPVSAIAKGLQAAITALAVALGAIGALALAERFEAVSDVVAPPPSTLVVLVAGSVAVGTLALNRSAPWRLIPATMLIAFAASAIAQFDPRPSDAIAVTTFAAAVVIGLGGQLLARLQHTTATVHTTSAVYVLVPGVAFYLSMVAFSAGATEAGVDLLVRTLGVAVAIAAGIASGVAVGSSVPAPRPRVALWRRREARPGRRVPRRPA